MKALFVTTHTNDISNLVDAWDSVNGRPAARVVFSYERAPMDGLIKAAAKNISPDVIFYVGACSGTGLPSIGTFRILRCIAPLINMVPDAGDPPWHGPIKTYRDNGCFDLYVGLDGCLNSPVDHVTVTPINHKPFEKEISKDILCGFFGGIGGKRDRLLGAIKNHCEIRVRNGTSGEYSDYAHFMKRCRIIFNSAWTGSGLYYHIKGRVIETGYARAALLEQIHSPIKDWFPENAYFSYRHGRDAVDIVSSVDEEDIASRAALLAKIVREKYTAAMIYKGILGELKIENAFRETA